MQSRAADAFVQMASRPNDGVEIEAPELIRQEQDLLEELAKLVKQRAGLVDRGQSPLGAELSSTNERIAVINKSMARYSGKIDDRLSIFLPGYLTIGEVQSLLDPQEVIVFIVPLDNPRWTFVWAITKNDARWTRSGGGTEWLGEQTAKLRCGLDEQEWSTTKRATACRQRLGLSVSWKGSGALPFDLGVARDLYQDLFGEIQDLIQDKRVLIVSSGRLLSLPFHVLVTKAPKLRIPTTYEGYRAAAWFGTRQPITVLPSISSLNALRRLGRPSAATRPMIGFGNPLLDGHAALAKVARDRQHCPGAQGLRKVVRARPRAGVAQIEMRGGLADLANIKGQMPLPETADELCAVAQDLKADTGRDIRLGNQATEREIRRLNASGELARYRMVHFATHGTLAGELKGTHGARPYSHTARDRQRGGRRLPRCVRDRHPQAGRRLGGPIRLQHRRGWCNKRRGAVGPGAGLHLRWSAVVTSLTLGGRLERHGQAGYWRGPRDGTQPTGRAGGGTEAFDACTD